MGTKADRDLRRAESILRNLGEDEQWEWIPAIGQPSMVTVKISRGASQGRSQAQDQQVDEIEVFLLRNPSHPTFGGVRMPQIKDRLANPEGEVFTVQAVILHKGTAAWKLKLERRNELRQNIR